jgi:hypothetical protein
MKQRVADVRKLSRPSADAEAHFDNGNSQLQKQRLELKQSSPERESKQKGVKESR